jgi:hypothetical protein
MCKPPGDEDLSQSTSKKHWWQWGASHNSPSPNFENFEDKYAHTAGNIVLAERGDCLFEDKALLGQKLGAVGMIVKNTEVRIFLDQFQ